MAQRRHGCQQPFTPLQVLAWICQVFILVWFAIVAFGFLSGSGGPVAIASTIWTVLLALGLGCWMWCQLADPARLDGWGCIVVKQHEAHYCAVCKKSVPGIDHQYVCLCVARHCVNGTTNNDI